MGEYVVQPYIFVQCWAYLNSTEPSWHIYEKNSIVDYISNDNQALRWANNNKDSLWTPTVIEGIR